MASRRSWQAVWILAAALLAAPLYGQAQDTEQQQPKAGRAEKQAEKAPSQSLLTDRQRGLLSELSSAIHVVANSIEQSVVHIEVTDGGKRRPGDRGRAEPAPGDRGGRSAPEGDDSDNSQVPEELREFLRRFGQQMPPGMDPDDLPDRARRGLGSGIVYDNQGHILTNNHVVGGGGRINVVTTDGREYKGEVVGSDPLTDVAVIKVNTKDLKPAEFGDSTTMEVGDLCLAVGNPFGLDYSVTLGIISAVGRSGLQLGGIYYQDFLQTDAAINPGNSGGPLVSMNGQVIGLNTAIATQTGQYAGVGFAIPSNMAKRIADILIEKGKVTRGWLGVSISNLKPGMGESFQYPQGRNGVLVDDVVPDSPAAKAGFRNGDIIMSMNGQPVKTATQLQTQVTLTPPGQKVKFQAWRYDDEAEKGKTVDLEVTLAELQEKYLRGMGGGPGGAAPGVPERFESEDLGLTVVTPTTEQAKKFGWTDAPKGAMVVEVQAAGEAGSLGIQPGDVIVSVQNQTIESAGDLEAALKKVSISDGFRMYVRSSPRRGMGGRYVYVQRG